MYGWAGRDGGTRGRADGAAFEGTDDGVIGRHSEDPFVRAAFDGRRAGRRRDASANRALLKFPEAEFPIGLYGGPPSLFVTGTSPKIRNGCRIFMWMKGALYF